MLSNLGELLPDAARRFGDKIALSIDEREFSFQKLDELSNRIANGLRETGVEAGDRVTLYGENSWEWVVSYYAIHKLGAVANPINVMLTPDEVGFVLRDCGAKALLATRDRGQPLLSLALDGTLNALVMFGDDVPDGATSFEDMLSSSDRAFGIPDISSDALSTICYTSGTTGHPKGAMHSHRSIILNTAMFAQSSVRTESDVAVSALPCPHVYGNIIMNSAICYGMKLVLFAAFDPVDVMDAIQLHRATVFDGVPTMYFFMLAHPEFDSFNLTSLKRCTVGGQTMPAAKADEFEARVGCPVLELWGMTEIAGAGTANPWYGENRLGSIGIGYPYLQTRIADVHDASVTLPPNEVGEFMVKGPMVMQGYYGNERGTRETITGDGWLHTGDLAKMDEDGYIWVVDRKKDMILTAGYNVYPAELERVISMHPSVALAAVGPQTDEVRGEIAKAYIVLKPGVEGDADAIIAHCRNHLAAYKCPRRVQFVEDVPKTSTGKILRRELKTLD